ncbi:MAG: hypothetical protein ACHQ0J_04980 [Candidatus Dormibacterales bacterium]
MSNPSDHRLPYLIEASGLPSDLKQRILNELRVWTEGVERVNAHIALEKNATERIKALSADDLEQLSLIVNLLATGQEFGFRTAHDARLSDEEQEAATVINNGVFGMPLALMKEVANIVRALRVPGARLDSWKVVWASGEVLSAMGQGTPEVRS